MWRCLILSLICIAPCSSKEKAAPVELTEGNWHKMLKDEWLVKFYAPWCPACRAMGPVWEHVAGWSDDLNINVASVDVTENPGLSGRFLITALPSIYHVKDGEFRPYHGPRGENEIVSFVDDKKWLELEPLPWYTSPTAFHMGALGHFFKLSVAIRDLHNQMTTEYGIPVWGSYCIFALATILAGLLLGLLIVYLCDVIYPPIPSIPPRRLANLQPKPEDDVREDDSDMIVDDRKPDIQDEAASGDASQPPVPDSTAEEANEGGSQTEDSDDADASQDEPNLSQDDDDSAGDADGEEDKNTVELLPEKKESQSGGDRRPQSARRRQKASMQ